MGSRLEPACVHQDEEEDTGGVECGQLGVVLHDVEQQDGHLLYQHRVECDEELEDVRESVGLGQDPLHRGQRSEIVDEQSEKL